MLGCEESHGYLVGQYAQDKDGAVACLLMAELAAQLKAAGKSVHQQLDDLFRQHGVHAEQLLTIQMEGSEGMARMNRLMDRFRRQPPAAVGRPGRRGRAGLPDSASPRAGEHAPAGGAARRHGDARLRRGRQLPRGASFGHGAQSQVLPVCLHAARAVLGPGRGQGPASWPPGPAGKGCPGVCAIRVACVKDPDMPTDADADHVRRREPAGELACGQRKALTKVRAFPHAPGVYLFKDQAGLVIYVGKATDLRARAGSYFLKAAAEDPRTGPWVARDLATRISSNATAKSTPCWWSPG